MKKGDYVDVTDNAKYSGQDMAWTEPITRQITLKKGDILYHFSSKKLTSFLNKTTCFFLNDVGIEYCYILKIEKNMTVDAYCDEVRIELQEGVQLQYLGKKIKEIDYSRKELTGFGNRKGWEYPTTIIDNRIKI